MSGGVIDFACRQLALRTDPCRMRAASQAVYHQSVLKCGQVCQLAVPAIRVYPKGTSVPAHERLAALGYREKERVGAGDSMADAAEPQLESTDDFLARVQVSFSSPL